MKKNILVILIIFFTIIATVNAQFGIQRSIRNKYKKQGLEHAQEERQKGIDSAENKRIEEAYKCLHKAAEAAEPGLEKAEEEEEKEKGEEYAFYGISQYNDFVEGYEADVASKDPADYKKYRFNTAIVEYEVEGHDEGSKTLYIDMGGYKVAEYIIVKKKKSDEKTAVILIGSDIISIDFEEESAVKIHNPMAYLLASPDRDWEKTAENILLKLGFEKIGAETIIGKECDVWEQGRSKIWVWDGLTMKSVNGKDIETATRIQVDTSIPQEMFEVPEGFEYEIIEAGDLFPELSEEEAKAAFEEDDEDMDELLDEIENMSYSEFKAKVLEEEPELYDEEIKHRYLYLRQMAKRRHQ
jgi:hypothetical protein